jgi:hypothetical protein
MKDRSSWIALVLCLFSGNAQAEAGIGYKTVAEARAALTATPGLEISHPDGWLVVVDRPNGTVWSFTPPDHEAYPAVVKRKVVGREDGTYIDMNVLCQAPKPPCDRLVESFRELNAQAGKARDRR